MPAPHVSSGTGGTAPATPWTPAERVTLFALCLAAFLGGLLPLAFGPFIPVVATELGTTVPLIGQIVTATLALGAVLGLVVGPLADAHGPRRLMLAGMVAVALSAVGTALAASYGALVAARLIGAVSGACLGGLPLAVAGAAFTGDRRRQATSYIVAALSGAAVIGTPALSFIGGATHWRVAFVVLAGVGGLGVALAARTLPPTRTGVSSAPAFRFATVLQAYRPLVRHRPTALVLAATCCRALAWQALLTYLSGFILDTYHIPLQGYAIFSLVAAGSYLAGSLAAGKTPTVPLRAGVGVASLATALLFVPFYVLHAGIIPSTVLIALIAVAGGYSWVNQTTLLAAITPAGRGTTMVFNGVLMGIGGAGGTLLGGVVIAHGGYAALAVALPLFQLVAALLVWRPRLRPQPNDAPVPTVAPR